jgi:hypothetical protein
MLKSVLMTVNITREMLKSVLMTLVKKIQIEILHWKMVKRDEFDFLKVKILLPPFQNECRLRFLHTY